MTTQDLLIKLPPKIIAKINKDKLPIEKIELISNSHGKVKIKITYGSGSIERVRRITGYFCRIPHCNDAKMAEIRDRVVHVETKQAEKEGATV